jgi:penicillin-binding protein 1A
MKILVKILSAFFAGGLLLFVAALGFIFLVLVPELPSVESLEDAELSVPLRIYDRNGFLLAEYGEHRRIPVNYEQIPKKIEHAFLAAEDDQFWDHPGVDLLALAAATFELVTTGQKTRGGSTITMQVARNFFLSNEKTYSRKLNEILLALKIEKDLDKKTILELYLNKIYLGKRAYGVVAAAQVYYGKTLEELTLAQAAMIAGLPKAPSRYNPISNPRRALIRRDHIIRRMSQLGYITEAEYQEALAEPVSAELHSAEVSADARYVTEMVRADIFEEYGDKVYSAGLNVHTTIDSRLQTSANKALRSALLAYDRRHGYRGVSGHLDHARYLQDPFDEGVLESEVIGNLQKGMVRAVEQDHILVLLPDFKSVRIEFVEGMDWAKPFISEDRVGDRPENPAAIVKVGDIVWVEPRDEGVWWLAQVPEVEGAIVSLDPYNGAVQALVGGFDYFHHKFNRAVQAKRQPGSNFKPFIYSAALEKGFTPASLINDAPVVFDDDSLEATWRPENYSGRFYGPTRLREALVKSRNLVSIRILQSIGLRFATDYAERFGFSRKAMPYDLSLSLGSGAFSPMEIVRSYAVFANGGYLVDPYYIQRVESSEGEVLKQARPVVVCAECDALEGSMPVAEAVVETLPVVAAESQLAAESVDSPEEPETARAPRIINKQNVYIIRSILREVVQRGTAVRAKALNRNDIAGKTGTTNDQKDAWFSGFNDQVVTTAWVGFDDQRSLGRAETGGRAALPMWISYMQDALEGLPESPDQQPDGVVTVRIDAETGERATGHSSRTLFEIFKEGTEPKDQSKSMIQTLKGREGGKTVIKTEQELAEELF